MAVGNGLGRIVTGSLSDRLGRRNTIFGCFVIQILEPGLVAAGLTGSWVRTVQGFIFLVAIVFYMYVDEPQRRAALMIRLRSIPGFGGAPASRSSASE